jgi:small ligand-binding sensory domain FIST
MTPEPAAFASALSQNPDTLAAMQEVAAEALTQLGATPDLAFLFFSADHVSHAEEVAKQLADQLGTDCVVGCSAESIAGVNAEIEMEPAISLWLARLPGTTVQPLRLEFAKTHHGPGFVGWPDALREGWPSGATLMILGDPFSFPVDVLLEQMNDQQPGAPIVGGMASAAHEPGGNRLILGRGTHADGAVGVLIHGGVRVRTVVSQGCRPIGEHFVITKAERNVIHQLGGLPAYKRLEEVYITLPTTEQRMLQQGLHVGRVVSEYQDHFEQGDFLVRNVVGVDPEEGYIAIGDYVRVGQTVQFHIRDADSADGELKQLLAAAGKSQSAATSAALLFTCNGRGTRFFSEPHHDAGAIHQAFGSIPLAGFFAAGEVGPIGGRNFLHGFTASVALFGT